MKMHQINSNITQNMHDATRNYRYVLNVSTHMQYLVFTKPSHSYSFSSHLPSLNASSSTRPKFPNMMMTWRSSRLLDQPSHGLTHHPLPCQSWRPSNPVL